MRLLVVVLLVYGVATPIAHSVQTTGTQASTDASALLANARHVMGVEQVADEVIHYRAITADEQAYQSDRTYPPFFSAMYEGETWFEPSTSVLRIQATATYPGSTTPPVVTIDDGEHAAMAQGDRVAPLSRRLARWRGLCAWAVIDDWSKDKGVRLGGDETFRDYTRAVLTRSTLYGDERLFVDTKTGFPVKLEFIEPHYLWGQRRVEYVWSNWKMEHRFVLPGSAFRMVDGTIEMSQTIGAIEVVSRQTAPSMAAPPAPAQPPSDLPTFLQAIPPTRTRVSAQTWLLSNRGYTEAVTVAGDDVFVFDATQSEDRARQDEEAIASLFPGRHTINVVVTDLAWPHIGGVRYWVSQGATIMAHPAARAFLQEVVDRRWTLAPDSLERKRKIDPTGSQLKFVAIDRPSSVAGGSVRLLPIDGIGSEVALMAYVPADKFLWASDYIQTVEAPSLYATEVMRAAQRAGVEPERTAAQHLPLTNWRTVVATQQPK
jgi:hypothetical protein